MLTVELLTLGDLFLIINKMNEIDQFLRFSWLILFKWWYLELLNIREI